MKDRFKHGFSLLSVIAIIVLAGIISCNTESKYTFSEKKEIPLFRQLPKALFITTGLKGGNGVLPEGIIVAIQSMNQKGVVSSMETREILFDKEALFQYNILVLSTAQGFHDNDRNYSLSFMSDEELKILCEFVAAGGVLIAGDNVGRNYHDGTDRISVFKRLTPENFPLAECLGGTMEERYMDDHHISFTIPGRFEGSFREEPAHSKWALVMDSVFSDSMEVLGNWILNEDSLPALIKNRHGKGTTYLLATSDFLQTVTSGGEFSAQQISHFYHYVIDDFKQLNNIKLELNPWPENYAQAFCVSLNANGDVEQYQRVFKYLKKEKIKPVLFTNGLINSDTYNYIKGENLLLGSSGFGYKRYPGLDYSRALMDIIRNENHWKQTFTGFRFPYTTPSYWGLMALNEKGVKYVSTIGANNLTFFHGSVVPYNLIISNDQFFTTSDIMEISPVYHDDFYFYQDFINEKDTNPKQIQKAVQLYQNYLLNYWKLAVKPYNGVMVYIGHPGYSGRSEETLIPLKSLVSKVKKERTWITTLDKISDFRYGLSKLRFFSEDKGDYYLINLVEHSGIKTEGVSLRVPFNVKKAESIIGNVKIKYEAHISYVVFIGADGQELKIWK